MRIHCLETGGGMPICIILTEDKHNVYDIEVSQSQSLLSFSCPYLIYMIF